MQDGYLGVRRVLAPRSTRVISGLVRINESPITDIAPHIKSKRPGSTRNPAVEF